ncbi:flagellar motor switch protein FliG [Ignavibacteria bacterium]|nr:flagellar motor switch protein FliG [Bacteroidota bacterium]MCZ2132506.1 flagellar motor switch protein FliG [Bacteroidota bacterium]
MKDIEKIDFKALTGRQRVAILLMTVDMDVATHIFRMFDTREVEQISVEITNLKGVPDRIVQQVVEEYFQMMTAQGYIMEGGLEYATMILQKTFGMEKAKEIIEKVRMLTAIRGFDILKKADPQQLASFLSKEHPQTVSLILSHLPADQSAEILNEFSDELRSDVLMRIATLGKVSPQVVNEIEQVVDQIGESVLAQNLAKTGGAHLVASILNKTTTATAKTLLESIEEKDPNMGMEIKRLMFLFEDIVLIDDKGIQRLLRDIDKRDLALSLKVSDEKIREKIFKNMSERASAVIKEELEFMPPVKLKDVEAAQMRIVEVVKRLEEREEIVIAGRGKDAMFV